MPATLSKTGEFGLIDRLKKQIGTMPSAVVGIGDDAAVVPLSLRMYQLLTADMLLEGVHFTRTMPPLAVGHKALACSISDIAAMGGIPKYALISLGAPAALPTRFVTELYRGMTAVAARYGVLIVGGDTVKSREIIVSVAMTGEVETQSLVTRSGARPGDRIFVTGPLGRSLASGWHLRFIPRVAPAQFLVKHFKPSAMIDVSDGLAADLNHILEESHVGALLEADAIPLRRGAVLRNGLYDGEDFELLFTLTPSTARRLARVKSRICDFRCIGEITDFRRGLQIKDRRGKRVKLQPKGFTHF